MVVAVSTYNNSNNNSLKKQQIKQKIFTAKPALIFMTAEKKNGEKTTRKTNNRLISERSGDLQPYPV